MNKNKYISNDIDFKLQLEALGLNIEIETDKVEKQPSTYLGDNNNKSDNNSSSSSFNNSGPKLVDILNITKSEQEIIDDLLLEYEKNTLLECESVVEQDDDDLSYFYNNEQDLAICGECSSQDEDDTASNRRKKVVKTVPRTALSYDIVEAEALKIQYNPNYNSHKSNNFIPTVCAESFNSEGLDKKKNPPPVYRTSDALMKYYAFRTPIGLLARCNPKTCFNNGECISSLNVDHIMSLKESFWGKMDEEIPSSSERRLKILAILRNSYLRDTKTFKFYVTNRDTNNIIVCEAAYLILLGLSNHKNASRAPSQWINLKKYIVSGFHLDEDYSYSKQVLNKESKREDKESSRIKFENAITFISFFTKHHGDAVPDATGAKGENGKAQTLLIAPFADMVSFHDEYKIHSAENRTMVELLAGLTVFTEAYKHLHKSEGIRLQSSKGAFNTCEICNNAKDLMRNKQKIYKPSMREVIQQFKHLHLEQQANERRKLDIRKLEAQMVDEFGQPIRALLFEDTMTQYTCRTPYSKVTTKGEDFIDTRFVGVEVYCGPIKTVFIYRIDSLGPGGANLILEVTRQALIDLSELLRERKLRMPLELGLQFDNCGENKNKEMFAYISILIEDFIFDVVEVCFLIVGHTHASIDQYFSRIAKAIYSRQTRFIGSPLGLMHLIKCCHRRTFEQEAIVRDITVHYDFAEAISPYLNHSIHYYSIPHYFIFKAIHPRIAIMQHMMFSTNQTLLPMAPNKIFECRDEILDRYLIESVNVSEPFSIVNGEKSIKAKYGFTGLRGHTKRSHNESKIESSIKKVRKHDSTSGTNNNNESDDYNSFESEDNSVDSTADYLFGDAGKSQVLTTVNSLLPELDKLSMNCIFQQDKRMLDESQGKVPKQPGHYKIPYESEIRKLLRKTSTIERGYIVWLSGKNTLENKNVNNKWKDLIKPKPFDFSEILSKIDLLNTEEEKNAAESADLSLLASRHEEKQSVHIVDKISDKKEISSSIPLSARSRKIYKSAIEISTAANWILKQVELCVIMVSEEETFFKEQTSNFLAPVLNKTEFEWYSLRNTPEKVLRLAQTQYDSAPDWEPLPVVFLTDQEKEEREANEVKHRERLELARKLGHDALVKIGHDFKDGDQIVNYGANKRNETVLKIKKAMQDKANKANKANKDILANSKSEVLKYYKCDVKNCERTIRTTDNIRCIAEVCTSNKQNKSMRYCSDHLSHEFHCNFLKKSKRTLSDENEFNNTNAPTNASAASNTSTSANNDSANPISPKSDTVVVVDNNNNNNHSRKTTKSKKGADKSKNETNNNKINLSDLPTTIIADNTSTHSRRISKISKSKTNLITSNNNSDNNNIAGDVSTTKTSFNDDDSLIRYCLFSDCDSQILHDYLKKLTPFQNSSNDYLFKLFDTIRKTIQSNKFENERFRESIDFSIYLDTLKILATEVFKIDQEISNLIGNNASNNEWRTTHLSKNKLLRNKFIQSFSQSFLAKYNL